MRYNITYNQLALVEYNQSQTEEFQLDCIDGIILQQLFWLREWEGVQTIKLADGIYFWVAYKKLISELPTIGIKSNDGLSRRIKRKLVRTGLIKLHVKKDDNSKTYWQFTNKGLKVVA
ncbi:hypothetical protein ACNKXS_03620, partial [Christiangramia marina]|uniref:hypothetical protein n=1 Tax=Christiangramia marina TaxID=409436 RepID=UPI003AA8AB9C